MSYPSVTQAARTSITSCAAGSPASKYQPLAAVTKMVLPVNRSHHNSIDIVNNDTDSPSCTECLLCNPLKSKEAVLPFRIAWPRIITLLSILKQSLSFYKEDYIFDGLLMGWEWTIKLHEGICHWLAITDTRFSFCRPRWLSFSWVQRNIPGYRQPLSGCTSVKSTP